MCVTSTRDHQSSSNTIICEGLGALEAEEQLGLELADTAAGARRATTSFQSSLSLLTTRSGISAGVQVLTPVHALSTNTERSKSADAMQTGY